MSADRPPLRLVGPPGGAPRADDDDLDGFEPVDRAVHDRHPPYRELTIVDAATDADDAAAAEPPRTPLSPRFVVAALVVFQLLAATTFADKYVALARGADQYRVAAALSGLASLCLYAGAVLLAVAPGRGRALFIVAAVGLGLSLPAWGVGYSWSWPPAFGAMLALAGAWFARAEERPADDAAAQP